MLQELGEFLLRCLGEVILYAILYYTGAVVIGVLSLGQLRLAPLSTLQKINPGRTRWNDWSIWLYGRYHRAIRADAVCLVGFAVWIGLGVAVYFVVTSSQKPKEQNRPAPETSTIFPPIEHEQSGTMQARRLLHLLWRENIPVNVENASRSFEDTVTISPQDTNAIVLLDKFLAATGYHYRIEGDRVTIFDPMPGKANLLDRPIGPMEWKDATLTEALKQMSDESGIPIIHMTMSLKAISFRLDGAAQLPKPSATDRLQFSTL